MQQCVLSLCSLGHKSKPHVLQRYINSLITVFFSLFAPDFNWSHSHQLKSGCLQCWFLSQNELNPEVGDSSIPSKWFFERNASVKAGSTEHDQSHTFLTLLVQQHHNAVSVGVAVEMSCNDTAVLPEDGDQPLVVAFSYSRGVSDKGQISHRHVGYDVYLERENQIL